MRHFFITNTLVGFFLLGSGCHDGNQFLVKIAPPPQAPEPAAETPVQKNMLGVLPMPTAMPYPIPHASDSEKQSWENHDLRVLSGCWQLGEDRVLTCFNGGTSFPCTFSALSVCFDEHGNSAGGGHLYYDYDVSGTIAKFP